MTPQIPAYCIGNFGVIDDALMAEYGRRAAPILQKFGGRMLASDRDIVRLEGEPQPVLALLEFPSLKAAEEFFSSPEYAAVRQMRLDATAGGFLALARGWPAV